MHTEKYKRQLIIVITAGILGVLAMAIIFWNSFTDEGKNSPGIWPFILLFVSVLIFGYAINITIKALNTKELKNLIEKEVSEERSKILKEFEKKSEKESSKVDEDESVQEKIKGILPKGNFKNIDSFIEKLLKNFIDSFEMVQGIAYLKDETSDNFKFIKGFALTNDEDIPGFKIGENINGQAVDNKEVMIINDVPEEYFQVESGLGQSKPKQIIIVPVLVKNDVIAVLEMGSFKVQQGLQQIISVLNNEITVKLEQIIKS